MTGERWRLPYEDEVASLFEGRYGENTLDVWAGYSPNPDDARRLELKAKELGAGVLLKEVGSFLLFIMGSGLVIIFNIIKISAI